MAMKKRFLKDMLKDMKERFRKDMKKIIGTFNDKSMYYPDPPLRGYEGGFAPPTPQRKEKGAPPTRGGLRPPYPPRK